MRYEVGNNYGKGKKGVSGRKGFEFEKDQLVRMRKAVDRALWTLEAIQKGKATDYSMKRYKMIEPTLLKLIDKLHASRQETDIQVEFKPIPLLNVLRNNSNQENLPDVQAYPSLTGGDISGQDDRN